MVNVNSKTRGPRWPWIAHLNFETAIANFFLSLSEKNLQKFTRITVHVAPLLHMPCLLTDQNFTNNFWKGPPTEHFYEIISKSRVNDFLRI